jgi:hypothetical protein
MAQNLFVDDAHRRRQKKEAIKIVVSFLILILTIVSMVAVFIYIGNQASDINAPKKHTAQKFAH